MEVFPSFWKMPKSVPQDLPCENGQHLSPVSQNEDGGATKAKTTENTPLRPLVVPLIVI